MDPLIPLVKKLELPCETDDDDDRQKGEVAPPQDEELEEAEDPIISADPPEEPAQEDDLSEEEVGEQTHEEDSDYSDKNEEPPAAVHWSNQATIDAQLEADRANVRALDGELEEADPLIPVPPEEEPQGDVFEEDDLSEEADEQTYEQTDEEVASFDSGNQDEREVAVPIIPNVNENELPSEIPIVPSQRRVDVEADKANVRAHFEGKDGANANGKKKRKRVD
jgi:hypothetical protein